MLKTLIFFIYLVRTGIKASISKRGAFLIECGLMIANNLIFLSIWWIFFRQFNHVAGWDFNDMIILMAVVTGGYGLMQICFGGVRELSKMITSGDLDPFMTQPKNLLLHVAGCKSFSKGWGNLLTAITSHHSGRHHRALYDLHDFTKHFMQLRGLYVFQRDCSQLAFLDGVCRGAG